MKSDDSTFVPHQSQLSATLSEVPWWLLVVMLVGLIMVYNITTNEDYSSIFSFLKNGVFITVRVTITAYIFAVIIGLLAGLGRVSKNPIIYNIATLYVQIMRGIPILVTILYVSFVLYPMIIDGVAWVAQSIAVIGLGDSEGFWANITASDINRMMGGAEYSMLYRGIMALALSYGSFSAEIFRAGIESIEKGQMEAARSLGMSYIQAMRYIILPQAIRRVLPPLGNDFIAMLKESSLVSVLGVRDITQLGKLYSARSFLYLETYNQVAFLYLTMTILLSLGVRALENRLKSGQ